MKWRCLLAIVLPACGGLTLTPTFAEEEPQQLVPEAAGPPRLVRRDAGLASDASVTRSDGRP